MQTLLLKPHDLKRSAASGDDNNPVLKLWDLRSSTTLPLATLAGHTEGVLSVAWCPFGETKTKETTHRAPLAHFINRPAACFFLGGGGGVRLFGGGGVI